MSTMSRAKKKEEEAQSIFEYFMKIHNLFFYIKNVLSEQQ